GAYYDFAALVLAAMLERRDAPLRARFRLPGLHDFGFGIDRIADEYRLGKLDFLKTEIADRGPQGQIAYRQTYYQAERENAVDQPLAELCLLGELGVEMERLQVHGQRGEQQIIGLGYGPSRLMLHHQTHGEFLKILARHKIS